MRVAFLRYAGDGVPGYTITPDRLNEIRKLKPTKHKPGIEPGTPAKAVEFTSYEPLRRL